MAKPQHNWLAECGLCKHIAAKKGMQRILYERQRYATPTTLMYLCKGCFRAMCETIGDSLYTDILEEEVVCD